MCNNASLNDTALSVLSKAIPSINPTTHRLRCLRHISNLTSQAVMLGVDKDCFNIEEKSAEEINKSVAQFQAMVKLTNEQKRLKYWRKKAYISKSHNFCYYITAST